MADTDWFEQAACVGKGFHLFFPGPGNGNGQAAIKRYCSVCPVTVECERYSERIGATHGVWGGKLKRRKD